MALRGVDKQYRELSEGRAHTGQLPTLGLLLFIAHCRTGTAAYYWASLGSMALAVLTKESAYAFPLLLAATLAVLPGCSRRDVKRSLSFWALAATLFTIRWWVLGGTGGYVDQRSVKAGVFQLGVPAPAKAGDLHIWSALYFPINWSVTISWLRPPGSPERRPDRVDTLDHLA